MIEIKVTGIDKKTIKTDANIEIRGYDNALKQFLAVLEALDNTSEDVLIDAIGKYAAMKTEGKGDDDDESES